MSQELLAVHGDTQDREVMVLWLKDVSVSSRASYVVDVGKFFAFTRNKPLRQVTLVDFHQFKDSLGAYKVNSVRRILAGVKSLFSFAHKLGYLSMNAGAALKVPKPEHTLSQRILSEELVLKMLALEPDPRNRVLLRLSYAAGLRVSEVCALRWLDLVPRAGSGQLTVLGKGGKTRHILLSETTWLELMALPAPALPSSPLFPSRFGGHLSRSQVFRVVQRAALRAGIDLKVSPHWFRHAHATHALERGAALILVQATLGHANLSTTGTYLHARPEDSSACYLVV